MKKKGEHNIILKDIRVLSGHQCSIGVMCRILWRTCLVLTWPSRMTGLRVSRISQFPPTHPHPHFPTPPSNLKSPQYHDSSIFLTTRFGGMILRFLLPASRLFILVFIWLRVTVSSGPFSRDLTLQLHAGRLSQAGGQWHHNAHGCPARWPFCSVLSPTQRLATPAPVYPATPETKGKFVHHIIRTNPLRHKGSNPSKRSGSHGGLQRCWGDAQRLLCVP